MTDDTSRIRAAFARRIAKAAGVENPRIEAAFAETPREDFAGPGPWLIVEGGHYVQTPDDDPVHLYQDVLVAIDAARGINIGEPALHALCLRMIAPQAGEIILHVGAGVGYYTAILARLVGPGGLVFAYEIDEAIAARARKNLAGLRNVVVETRSGVARALPGADILYVNAAAVEPHRGWLDALRPGGRLMFPLQAPSRAGAMLMITRPQSGDIWLAKMFGPVWFVQIEGAANAAATRRLEAAFGNDGWRDVQSLRTGASDATCWLAGEGWWLSTAASGA